MNRQRLLSVVMLLTCCSTSAAQERDLSPTGESVIRRATNDSEIVVATTRRLAGAIHSLTWNGKEFIDSADHGRQLQSASNLDFGSPIHAETFNPTEAGSRRDGAGTSSTSRLLHQLTGPNYLQTTSQMAFWLAPGERSGKHLAKNSSSLSNHLLTKRVQIGLPDYPQALAYDVTFHLPLGERHEHAVFEVVTGYMPAEFDLFLSYDKKGDIVTALSDGPGEQANPVILATSDKAFAMSCVVLEALTPGASGPGYGRFRFPAERVVKWNAVYRYTNRAGLPAGEYSFRAVVLVGDLVTVQSMLKHFSPPPHQ